MQDQTKDAFDEQEEARLKSLLQTRLHSGFDFMESQIAALEEMLDEETSE